MTIQIIGLLIVLVIVFFILRREHKKEKRYFTGKFEYTNREKKILEKYRQDYEPIPSDERLARIDHDKWQLEDIAQSATEILYDSPIPAKAQRKNLQEGDLVKLKFILEVDGEQEIERMWVKVNGEKDGLYFGELDNDAFGTSELTSGKLIWFHQNHVFYIDKKKQ